MKELTNIVSNLLGSDHTIENSYYNNNNHFYIYKKYEGDQCLVIKNFTELSPLLDNLIEANNWVNNNS